MTVTTAIHISNRQLLVQGKPILQDVPDNVVLTPSIRPDSVHGTFLGASTSESNSHHLFPLGVLKDLRFMCCFRFSLWWMTQRMGISGSDVPMETQFLLVKSKDESPLISELAPNDYEIVYTVFLPLLDGSFRASLQGNTNEQLELCLESGDAGVKGTGVLHSVFLHSGTNPFKVIGEAVEAVEMHMQTFRRREEKKMPGILDWFGWCTWNSFYTDVSADGVKQGLKSLEEGSTPARFVIIDDGWQSIETAELSGESTAGIQLVRRLTNIKENYKFQKDGKDGEQQEDPALGLRHLVEEIKQKHKLKYVYAWHAITGYWGGIKPDVAEMEHYESTVKYPIYTEGVLNNEPGMKADTLTIHGVGLAHPKKVFQFFDELHSYLASAGVDGVKVDVQNILETLGTGFGGRVSLTHHYHQALEDSVARNFPDNGCIACMSHNNDGLYSIKKTAIVRASDDFWPLDPATHTTHVASVAYNSLFLGEFMQPDWDMFQSLHPAAEYHAAARAIGGCPVYVSDKPGDHNFDLLKKLVLPDGSILRAQLPGRPTRDSLFTDPARDGKSLLKIWNMNKHTGVLGVFNCQGAGWCKVGKENRIHDTTSGTLIGTVCARDVDSLANATSEDWSGNCALYSHKKGELVCLPRDAALPVSLNVLEYELFTVSPIKRLSCGADFAPIGLLKMFNSGGAISVLDYDTGLAMSSGKELNETATTTTVSMEVHGYGEFGAYASMKPMDCVVNNVTSAFTYDPRAGLVQVFLPEVEGLSLNVAFLFFQDKGPIQQ